MRPTTQLKHAGPPTHARHARRYARRWPIAAATIVATTARDSADRTIITAEPDLDDGSASEELQTVVAGQHENADTFIASDENIAEQG